MGLRFSGTIMVDNVPLSYLIETAPYFAGHDVRVVIRSPAPDEPRLRTGAQELTNLVIAASAPPTTEAIRPLREHPSEYIVKIMVPMKQSVRAYTDELRAYVAEQTGRPAFITHH